MSRGEEHCIADMRAFITQFSLRQTTVATMTGVSQPYISKLLNGNHRELSLRCRKNIYCWYLNCRRHPEKLGGSLGERGGRCSAWAYWQGMNNTDIDKRFQRRSCRIPARGWRPLRRVS